MRYIHSTRDFREVMAGLTECQIGAQMAVGIPGLANVYRFRGLDEDGRALWTFIYHDFN